VSVVYILEHRDRSDLSTPRTASLVGGEEIDPERLRGWFEARETSSNRATVFRVVFSVDHVIFACARARFTNFGSAPHETQPRRIATNFAF
jgi:hypothetical protein